MVARDTVSTGSTPVDYDAYFRGSSPQGASFEELEGESSAACRTFVLTLRRLLSRRLSLSVKESMFLAGLDGRSQSKVSCTQPTTIALQQNSDTTTMAAQEKNPSDMPSKLLRNRQ